MCPFFASDKERFRPRSCQMNAREREHFGGMIDLNGTTGWFVGTPREPGVCEGFRRPPWTEREAVLSMGLATGILEGIARSSDGGGRRRWTPI